MVTEASWQSWREDGLRPYWDCVLEPGGLCSARTGLFAWWLQVIQGELKWFAAGSGDCQI
jgi:hypothetical protein